MRLLLILISIKAVLLLTLLTKSTDALRETTHEDIRDAILSLVHMFRDNTDKLERHESRERQLGEQFKKIFTNIEKKQKTEEETINSVTATLVTINGRLQEIESFVQQEKLKPKEPEWQTKAFEKLIEKIDKIETTISDKTTKTDSQTDILMNHLNSLENGIRRLESELTLVQDKLKEQPTTTTTPIAITTTTQSSSTEATVIELKLRSLEESLNALREHHSKTSLEHRENVIGEVKSGIADLTTKIERLLPSKRDVEEINNGTVKQLQEVKYDLLLNSEKANLALLENIEQIRQSLRKQEDTVQNVLSELTTNSEKWYTNIQSSYVQLLKEIGSLSKVEQVLIQTADNVLDTKKRIEYGTHHVIMEVSDLIKQQAKETNVTLNKRFDQTMHVLVDNQNSGVTNLSSKIEVEISQVWRQINIMYQTLTSTSSSLKHLENQTEMYVNGSLNTMHSMENKVGQIRSGMLEVDDNLNYLLGRLSLVTQEFNHIKVGLGEALEQVKANLHAIKNKVDRDEAKQDSGPGPNYFENITTVQYPIIDGRQLAKTQYEVNSKE